MTDARYCESGCLLDSRELPFGGRCLCKHGIDLEFVGSYMFADRDYLGTLGLLFGDSRGYREFAFSGLPFLPPSVFCWCSNTRDQPQLSTGQMQRHINSRFTHPRMS